MIWPWGFSALVVFVVIGIEALRWTSRPEARRLRMIKKIRSGKFLVVGTSGSLDYLKGTTSQRFWPVRAPVAAPATPTAPLSSGERSGKVGGRG